MSVCVRLAVCVVCMSFVCACARVCACVATCISWCVCYASVQCICVHLENQMETQCIIQRFNPWRHDTCTESLVHKLT